MGGENIRLSKLAIKGKRKEKLGKKALSGRHLGLDIGIGLAGRASSVRLSPIIDPFYPPVQSIIVQMTANFDLQCFYQQRLEFHGSF